MSETSSPPDPAAAMSSSEVLLTSREWIDRWRGRCILEGQRAEQERVKWKKAAETERAESKMLMDTNSFGENGSG